jgi:hypothetical protein
MSVERASVWGALLWVYRALFLIQYRQSNHSLNRKGFTIGVYTFYEKNQFFLWFCGI